MRFLRRIIFSLFKQKRYQSPLDGQLVTKTDYESELKYKNDLSLLLNTVSERVSGKTTIPDNQAIDDCRFIEIYNNIVALGVPLLSEEDQIWLKSYLEQNKTHWHEAKFEILRRKKI